MKLGLSIGYSRRAQNARYPGRAGAARARNWATTRWWTAGEAYGSDAVTPLAPNIAALTQAHQAA